MLARFLPRLLLTCAVALIPNATTAQEPHPSPETKKLAFMIGRFTERTTNLSFGGKPNQGPPRLVEGSWMLGGRYLRLAHSENGREDGLAIVAWNPSDHSYRLWEFYPDQSQLSSGRMEGDRLVLLRDPGPSAGIGVNMSGTQKQWADKQYGPFTTGIVWAGSPAARAGIRAGDIITQIEGQPTDRMGLRTFVVRGTGAVGTVVHLKVRRAGRERTYVLTRAFDARVFRFTFEPMSGGGYRKLAEAELGEFKKGSVQKGQYKLIEESEFMPAP